MADPVDCIDHGIARRCISDRRHGGGRFCCVCLTVLPVVVCFPPSPGPKSQLILSAPAGTHLTFSELLTLENLKKLENWRIKVLMYYATQFEIPINIYRYRQRTFQCTHC